MLCKDNLGHASLLLCKWCFGEVRVVLLSLYPVDSHKSTQKKNNLLENALRQTPLHEHNYTATLYKTLASIKNKTSQRVLTSHWRKLKILLSSVVDQAKKKKKKLNEDAIYDIVMFILHCFVANLMEPIFPALCVHWNSCSVLVACGAGVLDLTACPFHNERWGDICFHRQQLSFCKR